MGKCNIDHSYESVVKKLEIQQNLLPESLVEDLYSFLKKNHSQQILNILFHLLKKYDLASEEEQNRRNKELILLIS